MLVNVRNKGWYFLTEGQRKGGHLRNSVRDKGFEDGRKCWDIQDQNKGDIFAVGLYMLWDVGMLSLAFICISIAYAFQL